MSTPIEVPRDGFVRRYVRRYKERWLGTAGVLGVAGGIVGLVVSSGHDFDSAAGPGGILAVALGAAYGALIWGTLLNVVVALFPSRKKSPPAREAATGGPEAV